MSAYRRILVAVDGSEASRRGLAEGLRLAKAEGADLSILHVVPDVVRYTPVSAAPPADLFAQLQESGRRLLEAARGTAAKQGIAAQTILAGSGGHNVADSIVRQARKRRADLVVLGTHGRRGLRRAVLGSDAEQVLRASPVPVLMVRAGA